MSLVGPNGVPLLGGPKEAQAPIGGVLLAFFEDPRVTITLPSPLPPEQASAMLSAHNVYINAICRDLVALRSENAKLAERVAALEAMLNPEASA